MQIGFFEVASYEKQGIKKAFPQAVIIEDKLTAANASRFRNLQIISSFIYSNLNAEVLATLPDLKFIATRSTGFNHIDLNYCAQHNILVANVPEYGSNTVAEHTFGLILTLTRKLYQCINQAKNFNFDHLQIIGTDLFGKTIGIVGLGKIGKNVLRIAHGFGMNVLVHSHSRHPGLERELNFQYVELNKLLEQSDVITLHLPLTPQTRHIINESNINLIKKGAYLINTARGGLIETKVILYGLDHQIFSGVGLDVLEEEENLAEEADILSSSFRKRVNLQELLYDHVLVRHPRVVLTPHNAFNSKEALARIARTTRENINSFVKGKATNLVSLPVQ